MKADRREGNTGRSPKGKAIKAGSCAFCVPSLRPKHRQQKDADTHTHTRMLMYI